VDNNPVLRDGGFILPLGRTWYEEKRKKPASRVLDAVRQHAGQQTFSPQSQNAEHASVEDNHDNAPFLISMC